MSRTTWNIDDQVLQEVRDLAESEGRSAGEKASELLAAALAATRTSAPLAPFKWIRKPTELLIDLEDKDALYRILDDEDE